MEIKTHEELLEIHHNLKRCPFCGSKPILQVTYDFLASEFGDEPIYQIRCDNCGICTTRALKLSMLTDRWNKRLVENNEH